MPNALPGFGPHPVIVSLPGVDADDLVAACEVMWQEGLRTWSVPIDHLDTLTTLRGPFGRRAVVGVHGVTKASQGTMAAGAGATFIAAPWVVRGLVKAAGDVPIIMGGFTPTEVAAAAAAGAAAVQVVPADALPPTYAYELPGLVGGIPLIATGGFGPDEAAEWLVAGAIGVWTTGLASGEAVTDTDLDRLRSDCQAWQMDVGGVG